MVQLVATPEIHKFYALILLLGSANPVYRISGYLCGNIIYANYASSCEGA